MHVGIGRIGQIAGFFGEVQGAPQVARAGSDVLGPGDHTSSDDIIHASGKDVQRALLNQINAKLSEATGRLIITEEWANHYGEPSIAAARGVRVSVLDAADRHMRGDQHGKIFISKKGG